MIRNECWKKLVTNFIKMILGNLTGCDTFKTELPYLNVAEEEIKWKRGEDKRLQSLIISKKEATVKEWKGMHGIK